MPLPKHIQDLWDRAASTPGKTVKIGRYVVCESCDKEYTDLPDIGGIIVGSYAYGPCCAPRHLATMEKYRENHLVRAWCPADQSFADFVRAYRGPDSGITITMHSKP